MCTGTVRTGSPEQFGLQNDSNTRNGLPVSSDGYGWNRMCFAKARVAKTHKESHHGKTRIDMNALEGKLEAMTMTNPNRNTTNGERQANHLWYLRNLEEKAKYNAEYYADHNFKINHDKAVKRGNEGKQLKSSTVEKWNIKWNPDMRNHY